MCVCVFFCCCYCLLVIEPNKHIGTLCSFTHENVYGSNALIRCRVFVTLGEITKFFPTGGRFRYFQDNFWSTLRFICIRSNETRKQRCFRTDSICRIVHVRHSGTEYDNIFINNQTMGGFVREHSFFYRIALMSVFFRQCRIFCCWYTYIIVKRGRRTDLWAKKTQSQYQKSVEIPLTYPAEPKQ